MPDLSGVTEPELLQLAGQELGIMRAMGDLVAVDLAPVVALHLAGLLQLAQRHPELPEGHRLTAAELLRGIEAHFAHLPALSELLRRGDVPSFDVAAETDAPRIILP